jgi:hypothetical protein
VQQLNLLKMQDFEGGVPFFWEADPEGNMVLSGDVEIVKKSCGRSFAPFPKGNCCITIYSIT